MLLTISTASYPATDLGYLLHKHPDRFQSFNLSFGKAHVYYSHADGEYCSASLMLDVDPVGLVRSRNRQQSDNFALGQYVSDRPYVASSFMSVAIAQVYGSALSGRCKDKPDAVDRPIPLEAKIDVLPCRGGDGFIRSMFQPLGYTVEVIQHPLDEKFPEWGKGSYATVILRHEIPLSQLLRHLYVLIPVFDNYKHYYIGQDELEKLLDKGADWLEQHPEKETIARRYLLNRPSLYRYALQRLSEDSVSLPDVPAITGEREEAEATPTLNQSRYDAVLNALQVEQADSVLDLGCGEGKFLNLLIKQRQFLKIGATDVSPLSLQRASQRIDYENLAPRLRDRITLFQASATYRDIRFSQYDAAVAIEVIEHLDPFRLHAFQRVLFEFAKPRIVVLTTPNQEYNSMWPGLPGGKFRHGDHRFEWTRAEFQHWASEIASKYQYKVRFEMIGPIDPNVGAPTQMGVFTLDQ